MNVKLTDGSRTYICDGCGQVYKTTDEFNPADSAGGKDFCWKCHPKRMTYMQLIERLARGVATHNRILSICYTKFSIKSLDFR